MFHVYVLETDSKKLYVGVTRDLQHRLLAHKDGKCITTTKLGVKNLVLLHAWAVPDFVNASKLERFLHSLTDMSIKLLVARKPLWCDELKEKISYLHTTKYESRMGNGPSPE